MYTLGIDIGSASSKAVILKDGTDVVASAVVQVGTGTSGPGRVLEEVFSNVDLTQEDMDYTVATGYGRFSVENADNHNFNSRKLPAVFIFPSYFLYQVFKGGIKDDFRKLE